MNFFEKHYRRLFWGLLAAAAAFYCLLALGDRVWADEAYTFAMIRRSFSDICRITAADVHPPLYYFVAKLFGAPFGYRQFPLRLLSVLLALAAMAVGGKEIRAHWGAKPAIFYMALYALYPFGLRYSVEIRMYSLCELAILLNALFAYRVWLNNRPKDWVGFAAAGICAAYSHYFALVSAGVIYGLLFLLLLIRQRKLLKPWLLASAVTIAAYLPWLKFFVEQLAFKINNEYWIPPIGIGTIIDYGMQLLGTYSVLTYPLFFGIIFLTALILLAKEKAYPALLAFSVPVLTALLGIGVSFAIRPIFTVRYLVPCAPLLMFPLALGLSRVKREWLLGGMLAVLLFGFSNNLLLTLWEARPQSDTFAALVPQTQTDAWIVLSDNSLVVSQTVSYYDSVTPIYVPDRLGADNPYPNKYELGSCFTEQAQTLMILTDPGTAPAEALTAGFQTQSLGIFHDESASAEVWLLTR